jgi:carboxyl-terminal processing protease
MRNNPGGLLNVAAEVSDMFLEKGRLIVYTESRDSGQDMRFTAKKASLVEEDIPIVVLVNGGSASASEIVAGALMDWRRAVVMGQKTFGKGSVQSIIPLSDGSALRLTTAKYLTPDGHSINGVGIEPDIEVKISAKQAAEMAEIYSEKIQSGEMDESEVIDPQLQRAMELLQGYDIFKSLKQNIDIAKKDLPEEEPKKEDASEKTAPGETKIESDIEPAGGAIIMPPESDKKSEPEKAPVE